MNIIDIKVGDKVALVATARKVSRQEMLPAVTLLKSWGLRVVEPTELYGECDQMAGTDEARAKMLQNALDDESIRAVFCVRGGYGTVRIIDMINFDRFVAHPKWIVGYSDATVLHSHIQRNFGIPTLHAIMPINIPSDAWQCHYPATDTLHDTLLEAFPIVHYSPFLGTEPNPMNRPGTADGIVVGGNLSILYSLLGSASDIDTNGKILLIEDLDEYLYHVDRMMMALKRSGKLDNLKGLIVGSLSQMNDNAIPFGKTAEKIVWDAVKEYDYPVFFNGMFGHIGTNNLALPLGMRTLLEVEQGGGVKLTICP